MAAEYQIQVRCCNCDDRREMTIPFGTEVGQSYCELCGCKSLVRQTAVQVKPELEKPI